ncbi:choice-of-anchor H family protein [Rheinheimera fenheensis]|uniref:choice-of-anchor H family protein n=1 Tax=Rheinheimera fenheensis TaxID=3152295 RepID=UPI00325F0DC3
MKNFSLLLLTALWLCWPGQAVSSDLSSLTTERRTDKPVSLKHNKDATVTTQSYQSHVWFYSVDLYLSGDRNANGYYHRLELELDADTSEPYQAVFAEFSLLPSYGDERIFYTSSVFELYRQSPDDWLAIDTVLQSQFAADEYLLTVRLFDANTGYLLAEVSGFDDANLDLLAMEDINRDSRVQTSTTVAVSGGSAGILSLLALCLVAGWRHYRVLRAE